MFQLKLESKILFQILTILIGLHLVQSQQFLLCPSEDEIVPCTCTPSGAEIFDLTCQGPSITQDHLNQLIHAVRSYNGLTPEDPLHLYWLKIIDTQLTSIDIATFVNVNANIFELNNNSLISTFTSSAAEQFKLKSNVVDLNYNKLVDADLAADGKISNLFDFFDPTTITSINLASNFIQGPEDGGEIIPGLFARFPRVGPILAHNNLTKLEFGPMENYTGWNNVINFWDNRITKLGVNALKFNMPFDSDNGWRQIFLEDNLLNDENVHDTALTGVNGASLVKLNSNNFEFISEAKFKSFLDAVDQFGRPNRLDMRGNPFICDQRMKWLKDGRDSYEPRVEGMFCTNDEGNTIFNTTLV